MSVLPTDTFLGKLKIQHIYEYYDRPVLFSCQNAAQTHYLVVLQDETDTSDVWLYVALSQMRFDSIHRGEIDLYHAFRDAEDEIVYEVTMFQSGHPSQIRILPTHSLSEGQLPALGERLDGIMPDNLKTASG